MKKFHYNRNISPEQNSVISHLTRQCTLMEIARNSEERRRSLSRASSMDSIHPACTSTEKGSAQSVSKGKQNIPASSENSVTKKELSSPVLYKNGESIPTTDHDSGNAKSVRDSPFSDCKSKHSALLGDREGKLLSVSSNSLSPKQMSRCYYAIIVSIICLCLIGVMGVVSGLIYLKVFTESGKWNSISTMKSLLSGRYPASSTALHFKMKKETDVEHNSTTQKGVQRENPSHFESSVNLNKSNWSNKITDLEFDNISVNVSDSSSVFLEIPTNEIALHTISQMEDNATQFSKFTVLESNRKSNESENEIITSNIYGTEGFIREDHTFIGDQIIQKQIFNVTSPVKEVMNSIHSSYAITETIDSAVEDMLQNNSKVFMKETQAEKNQKHDFAHSEPEQSILPTTTLKAKEIKYAILNVSNTSATTPIISAASIEDELIDVVQFSSQSMNRDNTSSSTLNLDIPNFSSMDEHHESIFKTKERPNAFLKQTSTTITARLPKIPIDMKSSLAEALKHLQVLDNNSKLPTSRKKSIKLPKLSINSSSSENIKSKVQGVPKTTSSANEFGITTQLETEKFNSIVTRDGVIIPIPIQYMTSTKLEESSTTEQPVITRSQMDIKSSLAEALKHLRMLPKGSKLPSPRGKSASLPEVPVLSPSIETFPKVKHTAANAFKSNRLRVEHAKSNINGVAESVTENYFGISSHVNFANQLKLELDESADRPSVVIFTQPKKPFGLISSLGDALKYIQNLDQLNRLRSTPRQKQFLKTEK